MPLNVNPTVDKCTSFKSCKVKHDLNYLKVLPTYTSMICGISLLIFLLSIFGYMIYVGIIIVLASDHTLFGLFLSLAGILMFIGILKINLISEKALEIDKANSTYKIFNYWKPRLIYESGNISELEAVQVLKKTVTSHNSIRPVRFVCYEVNFSKSNKDRINIMEHGNEAEILKDAVLLSEFLGIQLYQHNA